MKIRLGIIALLTLLGATAFIRADLPRPFWVPRPNPLDRFGRYDPSVPVVVSVDEKATEARLIVPKQFVSKVAALTGEDDAARAEVPPPRWPIVALALPVAVVLAFGGLWLIGLSHRGRAVLPLALVALAGVGAAVVWGRAQPPTIPPPPPLTGKVTVEVVEEGDAVKLVLTRSMLKELVTKP